MSCLADVHKGILDSIFKEFISPTPNYKTFRREDLDTIVVTQTVRNKSKHDATKQAEKARYGGI